MSGGVNLILLAVSPSSSILISSHFPTVNLEEGLSLVFELLRAVCPLRRAISFVSVTATRIRGYFGRDLKSQQRPFTFQRERFLPSR